MQMAAPTKPQYALITRANLNHLLQQLTPLKLAFEQANAPVQGQQPGWARPVAANISAPYRNKIKDIEDQIKLDIDAADHLCTLHAQYVQSLLDSAKTDMAGAKKAIEVFEADQNDQNATQAARITNLCAVALDTLATNATEADKDYGKAWFAYRSDLTLPDPAINQDYFLAKRQDLIARGKVIAAKVTKCNQLHEQAKAYRAMSAKFLEQSRGLKTGKEEVRQTATELEAKLKKLYDEGINNRSKMGWQNDGRNWISRERALDAMSKKPITRKIQSEAASWMTELEAILKIYRNQVKTMETLLLTTKKPLTPKQIQKESKLFDLANAHVVQAQNTYKTAEKIVADSKRIADHIKQAHPVG